MSPEQFVLLALVLYVSGAVAALLGLRYDRRWPRAQAGAVLLAVLAQTAGISVHCAHSPTHYFTSGAEILWLLSWSAGVNYLVLLAAWRMNALGLLILPLNAALLAASFLFPYPGPPPVGGLDRDPLYPVHVMSAFLGYGLFVTGCAASVLYLRAQALLKRKLFGVLFAGLPSLERLDRTAAWSVAAGLFLFTVALALGTVLAVRANVAHWYLHPKILVAEATWLVFLVLAAGRLAGRLTGRGAANTILAGAGLVAATILLGHPFREAPSPRNPGGPTEPRAPR